MLEKQNSKTLGNFRVKTGDYFFDHFQKPDGFITTQWVVLHGAIGPGNNG